MAITGGKQSIATMVQCPRIHATTPFMRYGCSTLLGCDSHTRIWLGVVSLLFGIVACRSPLPEGLIEDFRAVCSQLASEVANRESMAVRGLDGWVVLRP